MSGFVTLKIKLSDVFVLFVTMYEDQTFPLPHGQDEVKIYYVSKSSLVGT